VGRSGLGLDQVLERPQPQASVDELLLAVVRQDHHWHSLGPRIPSQSLQDPKPIQLGQANVEKDHLGRVFSSDLESLLPVGRHLDVIAIELELQLVHLGDGGIVFDEQHAHPITAGARFFDHHGTKRERTPGTIQPRATAKYEVTVSAPAPLRLRPLEVGDVLDETFRIYRRHFLLFAGISVVLSIPSAGLQGYSFFALFNNFLRSANSSHGPDFNAMVPSLVLLAIGYVISLLLSPFSYGAVIYAACESALGRPVTVWDALRADLRRYFAILGYLFLIGLMGVLFCLLPLWVWLSLIHI